MSGLVSKLQTPFWEHFKHCFPKKKLSVHHHYHLFYVTFPLRVGPMGPMFAPRFFLHSILFNRSTLVSFQHLQSSSINLVLKEDMEIVVVLAIYTNIVFTCV